MPYLLEYSEKDLQDLKLLYGRTKGKKRKALKKRIDLIKKNLVKAQRQQKKVDKQMILAKHHITPTLKDKALKKGTKHQKKSQEFIKQAEKGMRKTGTVPGNVKVPKKATWGRKVGSARWKRLGKYTLGAAAVTGLAVGGKAAYKKIKSRRQEGMPISNRNLRDEILFELYQEKIIYIDESGVIRLGKLVGQKVGQLVSKKGPKVAAGAKKDGVLKRYGRRMGPLGTAFDVMFVFELGFMAYNRFFSKAAKACKGTADRGMCIRRFKIGAKGAQIKTLRSKIGMCSKDKDPQKCKFKVKRKIDNLKEDIKLLRQEL